MIPFQQRQPLPPQHQIYQQAQKGKGQLAGLVRGKGKAYTLIVDQEDASGKVVTCIMFAFHSSLCFI